MSDVDLLMVLVAALASMVIGAFWYSPILFGNAWMRLSGITPQHMEKAKSTMWRSYLFAFIGNYVSAFVLAYMVNFIGAVNLGDAVLVGFLAWLGFVATTTLSSVLWEGKPFALYIINNLHFLLSMIVMSIILTMFG